jgi:phosphoribosylaminoimidazolecarboxamide formyltransferase / IMP cyclohydrolase
VTQWRPVRRALIAVADKAGLVDLGRELSRLGVTIVSSGGTASVLRSAGIGVISVADVTGFPEMLGGRVKTLHPRVHAGILADRRDPKHVRELEEHEIEPFDLVVVNLYPFRETVARGAGADEVVENIDIGGPAMVRAAAKNFESVGVVVEPGRYEDVLEELRRSGGLSTDTRRRLAADAYAHTAAYDSAVASWFAATEEEAAVEANVRPREVHRASLPRFVGVALEKAGDLRYGENPHQRGALFADVEGGGVLGGAAVLQGKEMSFNNWLDVASAHALASELRPPAAVIVKHNNPCGAAHAPTLGDAYARAFDCDQVSAFGGVVAFNGEVDGPAATAMGDVFTEVVVAPSFSPAALAGFAARPNLRVIRAPRLAQAGPDVRPIPGGALVQDEDEIAETRGDMKVVSSREPSEREWADLLFAWGVAARVKSNAIVFAAGEATVGIGAGQMSRVDASFLAARKAGERARGAVMASDAFFPFSDAVEVAAEAGITAVAHPGGSVRDDEVLAAAERHGMAVVVTGRRHFRH